MSSRSRGAPRGRESRSPLTQTRSGSREATHSTARSTARAPREGTPRWKSERCAMRRPSSSGGSPRTGAASVRRRTHPASKWPHARAAPAAPARLPTTPRAFNGVPARPSRRTDAPETAPPGRLRCRPTQELAECSDFELLDHGLHRDDVPLELQLVLLEPRRDADELRQMEDRQREVASGRLAQLRLPRAEREVAERARRDHRVGARLDRLLDRLDQLADRDLLARLDDREAAAPPLRRVGDRLAAAGLDDPLQRPRPGRNPRAAGPLRAQGLGPR